MYRRIGVLICRHHLKQTLDLLKSSLVTTMITIVQARLPTEKWYFFYLSLGTGPIDCLSKKNTFVFFQVWWKYLVIEIEYRSTRPVRYTACQLYGITQLVAPFCLTADNIQKTSREPLANFYVNNHFCPVTLSLGNTDFPNCPKGSVVHLRWCHFTVSRRRMQITISNQNGNHTNQCPACNNWKYCSVLNLWAFSEGDESSNLTQGLRGHPLKTITSTEDVIAHFKALCTHSFHIFLLSNMNGHFITSIRIESYDICLQRSRNEYGCHRGMTALDTVIFRCFPRYLFMLTNCGQMNPYDVIELSPASIMAFAFSVPCIQMWLI